MSVHNTLQADALDFFSDAANYGILLLANVAVAWMLFRYRKGDSNMRSMWLCSRNDAIANIAVIFAAGGVWVSGTGWPDLAVAVLIAGLALSSATNIITLARRELAASPA